MEINSNKITPENFLIFILNKTKNKQNKQNNILIEPSFYSLISMFNKYIKKYNLNNEIEDKCYHALLLFTADNKLLWNDKIKNITKYFKKTLDIKKEML